MGIVIAVVIVLVLVVIAVGGVIGIIAGATKAKVNRDFEKARTAAPGKAAQAWQGPLIEAPLATRPGVEDIRLKLLKGASQRGPIPARLRAFKNRVDVYVANFRVGELTSGDPAHAEAERAVRSVGVRDGEVIVYLNHGVPYANLILGRPRG